jgi:hypothetical protein
VRVQFTSRTARVRFLEHVLTAEPFRHTLTDLTVLVERSRWTVRRDLLLLETECPRLAVLPDERGRLGLIPRKPVSDR